LSEGKADTWQKGGKRVTRWHLTATGADKEEKGVITGRGNLWKKREVKALIRERHDRKMEGQFSRGKRCVPAGTLHGEGDVQTFAHGLGRR